VPSKRPKGMSDESIETGKRKRGQPRERSRPTPPIYLEPWERQPGEAEVRYQAFIAYRDQLSQGQLRRGLERVAHAAGKHPTLIERWSREDHWRERCAAWDRHIQSVRDAAKVRAVEAIADREAAQMAAAAQALAQPIQALLMRINAQMAAKEEPFEGLTMWQLANLARASARALPAVIQGERLIQGLSTSNVDAHVSGDVTVSDARRQAEAMPPMERERFLLGEGFADGREAEREEAASRSHRHSR
jgi:hypothetical protein